MASHGVLKRNANTNQKLEKIHLHANEAHYRLIAENVSDLIWTMDMHFRFTYLSPSVIHLGGYSVEEAMELTWDKILSPESLKIALNAFQESLQIELASSEDTIYSRVTVLNLEQKHKDGHYIWTEVKSSFLHNEEGNPIGIIGITRDISKRKQAMDELAHNQRLLLALSQGAKSIQQAKSPEAVFKSIGKETKKLGLNTTVFTLNESQTILSTAYLSLQSKVVQLAEKLTGLTAKKYSFSIEPGNVYDQIIKTKESIFSSHDIAPLISALPKAARMMAKPLFNILNFQQGVIAPLVVNGKVFGLLSISGATLKESDLPTVTTFASLAAVAIENSLLVIQMVADSYDMQKNAKESTEELDKTVMLMGAREIHMAELTKSIQLLESQIIDAGLTPVVKIPLLEDGLNN